MRDEHKAWYANTPPNHFPLPLKERIRLAKEHMDKEGQRHDVLWPHQRFALTIGELIEAAAVVRGAVAVPAHSAAVADGYGAGERNR